MIKTEYKDNPEENRTLSNKRWPIFNLIIIMLCLIGIVSFVLIKTDHQQGRLAPASKKATAASTSSLTITNANQANTTQASSNSYSLRPSAVNLQNNMPAGNGSQTTSNRLQSTNSTQSTGQSINPNLPY
jgi:hypothetical protein